MLEFKNVQFCHVALVDLSFCFLIQNFAEIGQSVNNLWPKKRFSRWLPPPSWILKNLIFFHATLTGFNIWCSVPNFIKIGQFFTEIWRFYVAYCPRPLVTVPPVARCRHRSIDFSRQAGKWAESAILSDLLYLAAPLSQKGRMVLRVCQ